MGEAEVNSKKRYNVYLKYPVPGFGEPGQMGHFDMSAEETQKLIEKGAVERISEAAFSHTGYVNKERAAKNHEKLEKRMRRRR